MAIGLIGHGAVGQEVLRMIDEGAAGPVHVAAVLVRDVARHQPRLDIPVVATVPELLDHGPRVVVEAAGHEGFRQHAEAVLARGVDLIGISVGALADDELYARVRDAARTGGGQLRVCSGAIAGLDAISSAAILGLDSVTHTVRKPPAAFLGPAEAEALQRSGGTLELYHGPARKAANEFPENVNVVAAVSLAGIGLDRTMVRVTADAGVERNTHEIEVHGHFGSLEIRVQNIPSANPKTGRLVAPSLIRSLRAYREPIVLGG